MARNAFGLTLLVGLTLVGCSGQKEAKAAEAKAVALRVRTDSLRKARHLADSLTQVRYTVCVDSVRTEVIKATEVAKAPVVKKTKFKKQPAPPPPPSEEFIASRTRAVCGESAAPQVIVAAAKAAPVTPVADSTKSPLHAVAKDTAIRADAMIPTVDQTAWTDSVQKAKELEVSRETFAYSGSIRDPFNSLLNMAKAGPELSDLQLVGIYQNLQVPSGSVAVFREKDGGKRHKLRAGDQLGRSRVMQIRDRDVVFMIEDFGFERQETLSLRKQEDVTP